MEVSGAEVYQSIGNAYVGEFQSVAGAWFGDDECLVKMQFHQQVSEGLPMHLRAVAMLDAAGHPTVLQDPASCGRPFYFSELAECQLGSIGFAQNGHFWALSSDVGSQHFNSKLQCVSHMGGGQAGYLQPGLLEAARVKRCMYQTVWQKCDIDTTIALATVSALASQGQTLASQIVCPVKLVVKFQQ